MAQEANRQLQEAVDGLPAAIAKSREGYVSAAELDVANGHIDSLVKELEEAKAVVISSKDRAKAAVAAAEEERKAADSIILGLQGGLAALEKHVTEHCQKLLGESLLSF